MKTNRAFMNTHPETLKSLVVGEFWKPLPYKHAIVFSRACLFCKQSDLSMEPFNENQQGFHEHSSTDIKIIGGG